MSLRSSTEEFKEIGAQGCSRTVPPVLCVYVRSSVSVALIECSITKLRVGPNSSTPRAIFRQTVAVGKGCPIREGLTSAQMRVAAGTRPPMVDWACCQALNLHLQVTQFSTEKTIESKAAQCGASSCSRC
eukprot:2842824-Rhodomonas_salina.1